VNDDWLRTVLLTVVLDAGIEELPDAANQQRTRTMGQSPHLAIFSGNGFKSGNKLELQDAMGE
jgi:hypothetical protein